MVTDIYSFANIVILNYSEALSLYLKLLSGAELYSLLYVGDYVTFSCIVLIFSNYNITYVFLFQWIEESSVDREFSLPLKFRPLLSFISCDIYRFNNACYRC